jgi:filamentous hemagglutinin
MVRRAKVSKVAAAVRIALLSSSPWLTAHAGAPLPVPCPGGVCGTAAFAGYGAASYSQAGTKGTVNQTSTNAILNWQSFNIAAGYTMQFVQPSTSSIALNEIYDANPTQIFGSLDANGHVFLINQNGIVFGAGAQVNVGGLIASTMNVASSVAQPDPNNPGSYLTYSGLLAPQETQSSGGSEAAFIAGSGANGNITVEPGANIQAADGGQIYMFASSVTNLGTIQTPDGQTILAAGNQVYLAQSTNSNLRGMLVEVQGSGMVTNGLASNSSASSPQQLVGQIVAQHGNISLAALAVNQYGRVNANTSVTENGSIYLKAQQGTIDGGVDQPGTGGTLVLGQNSDTEAPLDTSDTTETVDTVAQPKSTIEMSGATIEMLQRSVARATSGVIDVAAAQSLSTLNNGVLTSLSSTSDGSRFYMAPSAVMDVSGANITLPVSDNVIAAKLEATELADSPEQQNGPLHGDTIYFDSRATGTNPDGSVWWGTPLANVTGEILAMTRDVAERNLTGGTISIQSQGSVIVSPSATLDVAGGSIQYTGGYIDTSDLLTLWGQTIPVASASPDLPYAGVVNTATTTDTKWGVTQTYNTTSSYYSPGYVEGYDGGTLDLTAPAFILDGTVQASTVAGIYQTKPTTAEPTSAAGWATSAWIDGSMYRPYDEVPEAATLEIGEPNTGIGGSRVVGNVTIAPGDVLAGLTNTDGSPFNPLTDPLPVDFTTSTLQPSVVNAFGNVVIYSEGKLVEQNGVDLSLSAGGSFIAEAGNVDIEGGIDVPAGDISLEAEPAADIGTPSPATLVLGAGGSLIADGEWINDSKTIYPNGNPAALYINGGTVSLAVASPDSTTPGTTMQLDPGSVIDVSGGAALSSSGTLDAGTGGSITINAATSPADGNAPLSGSPLPPTEFEFGATVSGYALYQGGSLSISAAGVCIAGSACGADDTSVLALTPQFFDSNGFSNYSITGDQGGLTIAPGTNLQLVQENLELPADYMSTPDAATLRGLASTSVLPLEVRLPVDLTLALEYPANKVASNGTATEPYITSISSLPSLLIPSGTTIGTDPGGSLTLSSNTSMVVDGTLRAPGGDISLALVEGPGDVTPLTYDPTQALWLGPDAVLDASGAAKIFPNGLGNPVGSVLAGGTVSLDADVGYLELLPGSVIDVNGTSGLIDVSPVGGGAAQLEQIASAGGTIDLFAQDGAVIGSSLEAEAGTAERGANQPGGGTFYLSVNPENTPIDSPTVPTADEIIVSQTLTPTVVAPNSAVPAGVFQEALLSADSLQQGGFSVVELKTYLGGIDFSGGVNLTVTQEISLDAETYTVDAGTTANVEAPYIEFGSSSVPYGSTPTVNGGAGLLPVSGGTGVLNVSGGFIELYGISSLQGVSNVSFDSSGDLRLEGAEGDLQNDPDGTIGGGFYADGTINLTAQQIYPTTLTQFVISADPAFAVPASAATAPDLAQLTSGSIVINGSEGTDDDLLSAGGAITLSAASITQDGVLRAPFGTITLYANDLTLGAGSLTSTSADGQTIPFGTTQAGTDWVYPLGYTSAVYGTAAGDLAPPSQNIALSATNINVQSGATIDISGGGNLQAYEWVPGTGGTEDVLGSTNSYAIVPTLQASVAPYDPLESAGSTLTLGESVHLAAGSGVPAGTYLLLPARYALLPGAYLVTPMSGTSYQDMQPGQVFQAQNGGTIVAGYLTTMGLSYAGSRWNGFEVTPPSVFMDQAQYTVTSGSQFFASEVQAASTTAADETAAGSAVSAMRLPGDAGVLDLIAGNSLTLDGTLRTSTPSGDRGAEVDISNPDIVVQGSAGGATSAGALVLTDSSLDQLGAQTVLLGGQDTNGVIETTAQNVTVLDGASLTGPQILMTALDSITLQSGASITAKGSAPTGVALVLTNANPADNDGAFLAVSAGSQVSVTRTGAVGNEGTLDLAAGSTLSAGQGSIYLDATSDTSGGIVTQGGIEAAGGSLAVQAPQIALGEAPSNFSGAVLGQNVFGSGGLGNLLLVLNNPEAGQGTGGASVSPAIQVYSGASIAAQNITIDAPGIESDLTAGQTATLSASATLTLGDSLGGVTSGSTAPSSGSGSGSLILSGASVVLGDNLTAVATTSPQQVNIDGFGSVALDAQKAVTAEQDITLTTDGNLSITASQVTTAAGATAAIDAQGSVSLLSPATPTSLQSAAALGGALSVTGSSIEIGTDLDLPSGNVTLTANGSQSGGITLDPSGSVDVAGVVQQYDTVTVATPGGSVSLSATGNINLEGGSAINVSAGTGGNGGSLSLSAPTGTVTTAGTLEGTGQGASFSISAENFDFGSLSSALNAPKAGQFSGSQTYWLLGSGDLTLNGNITASNVLLEADGGNVDVEGTINASGASGGSVTLAASNDVTLNGTIDANATVAGGNGGTVELDLGDSGTQLDFGSSSVINVSGGGTSETSASLGAIAVLPSPGGSVLFRVPYDTNSAVGFSGVTLDGSIKGASSTILEVYDNKLNEPVVDQAGDVDITALDPSWATYDQTIASNESSEIAAVVTAATASSWNFVVDPGIEIDATGSITLDTPWDLSAWHVAGPNAANSSEDVAGILTLRAAGGVTFNDSLSDGVSGTSVNGNFPALMDENSWSYRIVAGADLGAADPLAVTTAGGQQPASVTIGSSSSSGVVVRTGTGFIDVAASGDFVLGNSTSVLYTAGIDDGAAPVAGTGRTKDYMPDYATDGGDINIDVSGDVVGASDTSQFVNAWLWRSAAAGTQMAWTVDLENFDQGVGALGGGNVTVRAGGDVQDFSASIPSNGVSNSASVDVIDGGQLTVAAGGSIFGGSYFVGQGSATLSAGNSVGVSEDTGVAPLIGLGDASVSVTGRTDVTLGAIVNPTLFDLGEAEGSKGFSSYYFSTYGGTSGVSLTSIGGDVDLNSEAGSIDNLYQSSFYNGMAPSASDDLLGGQSVAWYMLPPQLDVTALSGNVNIDEDITLFPSSGGNLQVLAAQNINMGATGSDVQVVVPDADPSTLPSAEAPVTTQGGSTLGSLVYVADPFVDVGYPGQHGSTPLFGSVSAYDENPVTFVALDGDVTNSGTDGGSGLWSGKPVVISAGQDIVNLNLVAQNLTSGDVTSITAGGDITYPESRIPLSENQGGSIESNDNGIDVSGPGEVEVTAGGGINLGTSNGIVTDGNQSNPALSATGASISVEAGVAPAGQTSAQYAAFISQYIEGGSEFDPQLISYVEQITGQAGLTDEQAKQEFSALSDLDQRQFVEQIFFTLLKTYGEEAADTGNNADFAGAYAAIQALFPGANPNLAQGQADPYSGDISLYFSQIYTEAGGSISLLAPGGAVNVGLALLPAS